MTPWANVFSFFTTGVFYGFFFAVIVHYVVVATNFKHIEVID